MHTNHLVVALCLLFPVCALAQDNRAERSAEFLDDYQRARSAMATGNFGRAVPILEALLEMDPENGDLYRDLGQAYIRFGRREQAVELLMTAFEKGSGGNDYNNAYRIAALHAQLESTEEALDWLEKALTLRHVNRPGVATDAAFSNLSDNPRFRELAGLAPERELDREGQWLYDLDFLMAEIRRMNPRPGGHPDGGQLHRAIEALKGQVSVLDDTQLIFEMMKVIAMLGDGHSGLRLGSGTPMDATFVPVQFYVFRDGLFIIRGTGPGGELVGSKVLSINGHDAETMMEEIAEVVPHENSQGVVANGPFYLRSPELLHHLGLNPERETMVLELEKPDGEMAEVVMKGEALQRYPRSQPPDESPNEVPRYLQRTNANFWSEPLEDLDAYYVQFNAVQNMQQQTLERFAQNLRLDLEESGVHNVIVDVRHNGGGNNFLVKPMVRTLVHFEMEEEGNRVFVITSRHTYSACQNFLNRLESVGNPIVVGEPSSSKPNFIGESTQVLLPWSGLSLGISSRYWQDSYPEDTRPWIAPQIPVQITSEDWFLNRDPAMEAIRAVITGG